MDNKAITKVLIGALIVGGVVYFMKKRKEKITGNSNSLLADNTPKSTAVLSGAIDAAYKACEEQLSTMRFASTAEREAALTECLKAQKPIV